MNQLNSIILEGYLVNEPDLKETANGNSVCNFSVCNNRYTYEHDNTFTKDTSFFNCVCWNKSAIMVGTKCKKGNSVRIVGRLHQNRWQDSDGKNHSTISVICEHVERISTSIETHEATEQNATTDVADFVIPF